MTSRRHRGTLSVVWGIAAGLLLHALAGGWSDIGFAQGTNTTFTVSTTTSTSVESPPACTTIGSSRTELTVSPTADHAIGPSCIGIGNRDLENPSPACGTAPPGNPDPFHGTVFLVLAGTENFNVNTHTETILCVAAVPAMPWPAFAGLAGLLTAAGAWWIRRRALSAAGGIRSA